MSDPLLDCYIDNEQYKFLNGARAALEMHRATGNLPYLDYPWLKGASGIYALIFNDKTPNIHCGECVKTFVRPLLNQIHQYEKKNNIIS